MRERVKDSRVGTVVDGRYRVTSRLARGGMSTVYLATDLRLERDVALKILFPHLAEDQRFLERFEREAKSAARLSHPHVVGVLDQGIEDGPDHSIAYLVMEYVPGRTLRDLLIERGRLTPRQALAILDPVIEGLGAAHDAGLIHRDVKPENVLLAERGGIKIADFGLARAVSAGTNTGTLVGTAAYLPPELLTGDAADARSDIYSAGIMLFELLTGSQPYTGEAPIQIAFQHVNSRVPAPSTRVAGLAEDLDELVLWCTSVDPEERPVDGNALLGELRHIRTTLTDEDLDFGHEHVKPGAVQTAVSTQPAAPHATEVIRTGYQHTEVVNTGANPTEVVNGSHFPTTVLGNDSNSTSVLRTSKPAQPPLIAAIPEQNQSPAAQEKAARKDFKAHQREQAKAAQRPEKTLRPGGGRRRNFLLVLLLVLIAFLAAAAGWFFGAGPGAAVAVPDVANRPVTAAQAMLGQAGLSSTASTVYSDTVEEGLVISSEPQAPAEVRPWEGVQLFVSLGPQLFEVPATDGLGEAAAAGALVEAGFQVGDVARDYSEQVPAGQVIASTPEPGSEHRSGTVVNLTVSQGPEPIAVPAVTGLLQEEAVAAIEAVGLAAQIVDAPVNDRAVPEGAVLSQSPADGQLTRGQAVSLTISAGPRMVAVPNVFSQPEDAAIAKLEAAGFTVEVSYAFGESVLGLVAGQDLTGEHPEGSTVVITVT